MTSQMRPTEDYVSTPETPIISFARGTSILTESGNVPVENLAVSDMIWTKDNGFQPIRWIGRIKFNTDQIEENPKLRPVRITAGALGRQTPSSDLVLSPQHRILVTSKIAQRMFDVSEVLIVARHLLLIKGVALDQSAGSIEYVQLLLDKHEIIQSNGTETESLLLDGESPIVGGSDATFTGLNTPSADNGVVPARYIPSNRMARAMVARHIQKKLGFTTT